jgi:hypothetical protein
MYLFLLYHLFYLFLQAQIVVLARLEELVVVDRWLLGPGLKH